MINSRRELRYYIKKDKEVAGRGHKFMYIFDEIGKYLYILKKREYFYNKAQSDSKLKFIYNIRSFILRIRQHKLGVKLGFDLPINTFGPGLRIDHWGFIVVNENSKVGSNCHLYGDITIGIKDDSSNKAPIIGDNVVIGSGARIIGNVKIGSNCIIGANACVVKSEIRNGKTIVGVPGRAIN